MLRTICALGDAAWRNKCTGRRALRCLRWQQFRHRPRPIPFSFSRAVTWESMRVGAWGASSFATNPGCPAFRCQCDVLRRGRSFGGEWRGGQRRAEPASLSSGRLHRRRAGWLRLAAWACIVVGGEADFGVLDLGQSAAPAAGFPFAFLGDHLCADRAHVDGLGRDDARAARLYAHAAPPARTRRAASPSPTSSSPRLTPTTRSVRCSPAARGLAASRMSSTGWIVRRRRRMAAGRLAGRSGRNISTSTSAR